MIAGVPREPSTKYNGAVPTLRRSRGTEVRLHPTPAVLGREGWLKHKGCSPEATPFVGFVL